MVVPLSVLAISPRSPRSARPAPLDPLGAAREFHVDREALIACLESDPEIRIGLGSWASWFVDEPLARYLDTQPTERFVPMRLHYRGTGGGLPVSEERLRRRWKGM